MADENEKRKINRIQLFGFMLEKQREINVFRDKPVFPDCLLYTSDAADDWLVV